MSKTANVFSTIGHAIHWRCIGPPRGGRVVAVAGDPQDRNIFYFGGAAGGVWKTYDAGTYWQNVSDGFFTTGSVGAIAVSDSDHKVIYAGTGESCIRNDVSHGDGIYRSGDGGETWVNVGLRNTRHIARVRINPNDPDLVYVAALGHAFGSNSERGVFRTRNGGETWENVLFKSDRAGACDLSLDPNNPRILYASIWEARRTFWDMTSGGDDSGLWKSTDGGNSWVELTNNSGMPTSVKGRIGVAVSPAKSGRVWALIEAKEGGLFRSDDHGETWQHTSDSPLIRGRAWYYSHIFADPAEPDTVWSLCWEAWKSTDGGYKFEKVTMPHDDNHDLWIDPKDPLRMIEGNDGGACITNNGGSTWSSIYNQPTSQFYHLATDNQFPYRAYATQQDNSAVSTPSRSDTGAILWGESYVVGSAESGHIVVKPDDPNVVYMGATGSIAGGGAPLLRYDHRTKQTRAVTVWPEANSSWLRAHQKYRFAWTFPIEFSPHDTNTIYVAANVVFRSTDEGESWDPISPDLTRDDPDKQKLSGGLINPDSGSIETYCTIFAFVESPHQKNVFWAGSDDGLINLSMDGGATWRDVTPPDLPEWSMIHMIEPSPHHPATVYVAATRYKLDDYRPLLYKTDDFGRTWEKITNGISSDDFTRVIRVDPINPGLLYAGTETGVYVSFNDGFSWNSLQINLPVVPIYDMEVKNNDLILATHGRSFWVLEGLNLLRQLDCVGTDFRPTLFKPASTYRMLRSPGLVQSVGEGKNYSADIFGLGGTYCLNTASDGDADRVFLDAGTNPTYGVVINYFLTENFCSTVSLRFLDADRKLVSRFPDPESGSRAPTTRAGLNRFVWDMRFPDAELGETKRNQRVGKGGIPGIAPLVTPGRYRVELVIGDQIYAKSFELLQDPRTAATKEDFEAQLNLLLSIRERLTDARRALNQITKIEDKILEAKGSEGLDEYLPVIPNSKEDALLELRQLRLKISGVGKPNQTSEWNPSGIAEMLEALFPVVSSSDSRPTRQSYEVFKVLSDRLDEHLRQVDSVIQPSL